MKTGERLLLVLSAFAVTALTICVAACVWSERIYNAASTLVLNSFAIKLVVTAVLLLVVLLSVRLMFVCSGKQGKTATLAATTQDGGIYINLDTISDLAAKAVKKVEGVKEIKIHTSMDDQGANIAVKAALAFDSVIPEKSAQIQQNVKADIEALCGIKVNKITVQVDNALQAQRQ